MYEEPNKLPVKTKDLIQWLKSVYVPKCYSSNENLHEHLEYSGKVQLVSLLETLYNRDWVEVYNDDTEEDN